MSTAALQSTASRPATSAADRWVAGGAVAFAGVGSVVSIAGAGSGNLVLLCAGGGLLGVSLFTLLVGRWVSIAQVVLLSLPLPALYSSDTARVAPAILVTAAVIGAWILRRATDPARVDVGPLPVRATLLLPCAALLSAMFAQSSLPALRELVNLGLLLGLLVVLSDELRRNPQRTRAVPLWVAGIAGLAGIPATLQMIGILPSLFQLPGSSFYRATLGFGWPNEAGMFFALSLPFCVYAARSGRGTARTGLGVLAAVGCLMGLLATYSRGSWLAVLLAPAVLVLAGERRAPLRFWLLIGAGVLILNLVVGGVIYQRAASLMGDWIVEQRTALMLAGLLMFQAHPLVGVGPGGFGGALQEFGPRIPWLWDYTGSAHNAFVHAAAEMGVFGVGALVVFLASVFLVLLRSARRGVRARAASEDTRLRSTALWAFTTACLVSFLEWPLAHGVGQLIMLIAALGFACDAQLHERVA